MGGVEHLIFVRVGLPWLNGEVGSELTRRHLAVGHTRVRCGKRGAACVGLDVPELKSEGHCKGRERKGRQRITVLEVEVLIGISKRESESERKWEGSRGCARARERESVMRTCHTPMFSSHKMGPAGEGVHSCSPGIGLGRAEGSGSALLRGTDSAPSCSSRWRIASSSLA